MLPRTVTNALTKLCGIGETSARPAVSPTHNRVLSDSSVTVEHVISPNRFQDSLTEMVASPLPYTGLRSPRELDEKGDLKAETTAIVDEPEPVGWRASPTWIKLTLQYDLAYHYLKQRWGFFCAFLLVGIVCCSIAIGWRFRLKTFNIADPDSVHDSIVRFLGLYHRPFILILSLARVGATVGKPGARRPIRTGDDLGLEY